MCNFWQKTLQAVCLFIFQFQNIFRLFANDDFNFSFFFMYRLRPFAYPWGSTHPSLGNGFVCRCEKGREKKLVSYICTNRCGTCGRGGSHGNDRVTYCRWVEERNVIAAVLVLFSVTFIQRPSIKYLHSSRHQNCIVPPDCC